MVVVIRILDLYSGMGGLSLGFTLGLEDIEVLGVDIDKYAVMTYNHNLRERGAKAIVADVLSWEPDEGFDVVIGGVPCQPYSIANRAKQGKEHPLYPTLPRFFDLVLYLRPKAFLMENVKGLASKKHRSLFLEQIDRVSSLYTVKYRVLNSAYYGVPQRRERLFVFGIRKDIEKVPSFPSPTHGEIERRTLLGRQYKWVTVREAIGDLLDIPPQGLVLTHKRSLTKKVLEETWRPFFTTEEPSFTVTESGLKVVSEHDMTGRLFYTEEQLERVLKFRKGKLDDLDKPSRVVKIDGRGGDKTNDTILVPVGATYRRLTVREVLRLQSFPDWWSFPKGVSVSRKYRLVGEAVPPIMAYRLAVHIGRVLGWGVRVPPKESEWSLPYFYRAFSDFFVEK